MKRKNIIILLTLLFSSYTLNACRCATFNFNEQIERATSIFLGSIKEQNKNEVIVHVIKLYKGNLTTKGEFLISQSNSSCYKKRNFTIGEELLIFSDKEGIHNCSRTKNVEFNSDFELIEKLNPKAKIYDQDKYDEIVERLNFLQDLLKNCGIDNGLTLNNSEIEFLITYLESDKSKKEFEGKNILFVTGPRGSRITDKSSYFNSIKSYNSKSKKISTSIIWLDDEMKTKSSGYDAIITYWVKVFSKRQLKKIVKKARKQKNIPVTMDKK